MKQYQPLPHTHQTLNLSQAFPYTALQPRATVQQLSNLTSASYSAKHSVEERHQRATRENISRVLCDRLITTIAVGILCDLIADSFEKSFAAGFFNRLLLFAVRFPPLMLSRAEALQYCLKDILIRC